MDLDQLVNARQTRRSVLRKFGTAAGVGLTLGACSWIPSAVPTSTTSSKSIDHVLIVCQENHTFDTYFGRYPRNGKFDILSNSTHTHGHAGNIIPYHFSSYN